jgi:hypothetical protein
MESDSASSSKLKDVLDDQIIALQTCQMHLDTIQNTTQRISQQFDQELPEDPRMNWLELLQTAGTIVGAFVGVSNMVAIRNIQSDLRAPLPQRRQQQSFLRRNGAATLAEVVLNAEAYSTQDASHTHLTSLDDSVTEDHSSSVHAKPSSPRSPAFIPSSPAIPSTSSQASKRGIGFRFSIKSIEPDYEVQAPRFARPPYPLWLPPNVKAAFTVSDDTGWCQWYNGTVNEIRRSQDADVRPYSTTSMFWCHDRRAFLQVPYDCTEKNVRDASYHGVPLDWERLSFQHKTTNGHHFSLVGYQMEHRQLGRRGSPFWVPRLLPEVYQYTGPADEQDFCQLAGDLSIIMGLVAFSTSPQTIIQNIGSFLRKQPWGPEESSADPQGRGSMANLSVARKVANFHQGFISEDSSFVSGLIQVVGRTGTI